MGSTVPIERDHSIDLECGGTTTEEEGVREPLTGVGQAKRLFGRVWGGCVSFDGSLKGEVTVNSFNNFSNSAKVSIDKVELLMEKNLGGEEKAGLVENNLGAEKPKKKSCKKPPKPPRPPKPPSLDAADQKLVREISELAMLKRARIERLKALKKMKAAKAASSSSNTCATVITIIFCLVIILQGAFSRSSANAHFQGSPESAVEMRGGLISVEYYKNASTGNTYSTGSGSPTIVEQVSGLSAQEEVSRASG
ncbi:uncharacterized protein LOC131225101 [Magnolia sinica]|uniref:uncharacterized protein LOC131225101 n=1 Tax=Magnolia sinica TaxID=86752 RepID=UPI002659C96B|nr:uncharacterized protein LOC131225101 [Magnolia sinica]